MILRWVHHGMGAVMRLAGFRFDMRKTGDSGVGLWRKTLRPGTRRFVFIPGFGDTPISWLSSFTSIAPTLLREFDEIVFFDFPGFSGFLANEKAYTSMDLFQAAVFDAIDSLKPKHLMGHSLGGWLAAGYGVAIAEKTRPALPMQYAGPEQITVICPSGVFADVHSKKEWEERFYKAVNEGFSHIRDQLFENEPIWFKFLAPEFSKFISRAEIKEFVHSVEPRHALTDRISNLKIPLSIIWGEKDRLVPSQWAKDWVERVSSANLIWIEGSGHSPQIESPLKLRAALKTIMSGQARVQITDTK